MFSKRIVSLLCGSLLASVAFPAHSPAASSKSSASSSSSTLDVNFFYDTLKDDGEWFNTPEYGDVWQPYIAYKSDSWRPYTDGYWTYTDGGWMFVSYENFGWAVYHYGRWTQLKDIGWAWVPGTDWSPAWVTWRESSPSGENGQPAANVAANSTDADQSAPPPAAPRESSGNAVRENYIGWAPLPPDPEPVVAYNSDYSCGPSVDIDYDIDPYDYCFTDVRFFGAPFIASVLFDRGRSYDCCERSINVTNIYYNRRGGYQGFYAGGPRYERFNGITERPIPRYNINRQQGRFAQDAVRAGQFNQIDGNKLNVVAPRFSQKGVNKGRVSFKDRGTLPVSRIDRERPAAAQAGNEARQKAREAFRQQGETFRAQNPKSQSARRAARQAARAAVGQPAGNDQSIPKIATTPRAQREERQARQAARQAGGGNPEAAQAGQPGGQPDGSVAKAQTRSERRAARQEARRQASGSASAARAQGGGGDGAASAARQQAREARRAARESSGGDGGGEGRRSAARAAREAGGGGRAFRQAGGGGGGEGRAFRGGGGGEGRAFRGGGGGGGGGGRGQGGGGGGGGHGDGDGGKKKK